MSKFRELVEGILKEYDYDDYDDERYGDPDDHTGSHVIKWTANLPMCDGLRKIIIDENIRGVDDLKDDEGNWLPNVELDVIVDCEVLDNDDGDEYIRVDAVYFQDYDKLLKGKYSYKDIVYGTEITNFLPRDYLDQLSTEIEDSGEIELSSYDYEKQVRDDYYSMIAPGGKL